MPSTVSGLLHENARSPSPGADQLTSKPISSAATSTGDDTGPQPSLALIVTGIVVVAICVAMGAIRLLDNNLRDRALTATATG